MTSINKSGARLSGKVALVSGGARGMGESHVRALIAEGAKVVFGDILDEEGQKLADELGSHARFIHLDVTNRKQWQSAVALTLREFGKLNILVNNAGIANFGPIGQYSYEQWDTMIAVNLTGTFNGIHESVEALKASAPSSIINISSTAGIQGFSALPGYNASKFGVRGLTKSVALDLGLFNVRCNSIHPGVITTPMTEGLEIPTKHVALNRRGESYEISNLVVYLASDESSFSTGSEFVADGGETAGLPGGALS